MAGVALAAAASLASTGQLAHAAPVPAAVVGKGSVPPKPAPKSPTPVKPTAKPVAKPTSSGSSKSSSKPATPKATSAPKPTTTTAAPDDPTDLDDDVTAPAGPFTVKPTSTTLPKSGGAGKSSTGVKAPSTTAPKTTSPPKPKVAPKGAKYVCKDGTYSFVKTARFACVGHSGVAKAL